MNRIRRKPHSGIGRWLVVVCCLTGATVMAAEPDESGIGGSGHGKPMMDIELFQQPELPDTVELPDLPTVPDGVIESLETGVSDMIDALPAPPDTEATTVVP